MRYRLTANNKIITNETCISFEEIFRFSRSRTPTPDKITFATFFYSIGLICVIKVEYYYRCTYWIREASEYSVICNAID